MRINGRLSRSSKGQAESANPNPSLPAEMVGEQEVNTSTLPTGETPESLTAIVPPGASGELKREAMKEDEEAEVPLRGFAAKKVAGGIHIDATAQQLAGAKDGAYLTVVSDNYILHVCAVVQSRTGVEEPKSEPEEKANAEPEPEQTIPAPEVVSDGTTSGTDIPAP